MHVAARRGEGGGVVVKGAPLLLVGLGLGDEETLPGLRQGGATQQLGLGERIGEETRAGRGGLTQTGVKGIRVHQSTHVHRGGDGITAGGVAADVEQTRRPRRKRRVLRQVDARGGVILMVNKYHCRGILLLCFDLGVAIEVKI